MIRLNYIHSYVWRAYASARRLLGAHDFERGFAARFAVRTRWGKKMLLLLQHRMGKKETAKARSALNVQFTGLSSMEKCFPAQPPIVHSLTHQHTHMYTHTRTHGQTDRPKSSWVVLNNNHHHVVDVVVVRALKKSISGSEIRTNERHFFQSDACARSARMDVGFLSS